MKSPVQFPTPIGWYTGHDEYVVLRSLQKKVKDDHEKNSQIDVEMKITIYHHNYDYRYCVS